MSGERRCGVELASLMACPQPRARREELCTYHAKLRDGLVSLIDPTVRALKISGTKSALYGAALQREAERTGQQLVS